ncbi:MAG: DUF3138 domain-containing protein [Betaproteobacteria bacterium HGW-Betaproteobacteria-22]|nr:MAG: DUF3138 domain-containing protein [Betaproteobacteria bacterium HGW-Betaproteobacteria-22]
MKHNYKLAKAVTGALLVLSAGASSAFAATNEELEKQLEALQKTVESLKQQVQSQKVAVPENIATQDDVEGVRADLENYKYDESRLRERSTIKSTRDSTLFGVVQVRAQAQNEGTTAGNPAPTSNRSSTFDVPTALLGVRGNLYRDYVDGKNLDYQFSFTYSKRATAGATSDLNLADAFLRYNFTSTNGGPEIPRFNVTFGQQLLPFGQEAQSPEDLRPTINVSQASGRLGLFTRQVGAVIRGDVAPFVDYGANYRAPLAEYALGVVNGNVSNKVDDNNNKAIIGRAAFTLPVAYNSWLRELKAGASFYKGDKNVQLAGTNVDSHGKNDRYGFDIYYNHAPYGVTYEYIQGRDDFQVGATNTTKEAKSKGHTLTLFYTFGDQFYNSIKSVAKFDDWHPQSIQPFYRYDYFNPNDSNVTLGGSRGKGDDTVTVNTLGVNWFFAQTTKLQVGINHWNYETEKTLTGAKRKDFTELQAQFQYTF